MTAQVFFRQVFCLFLILVGMQISANVHAATLLGAWSFDEPSWDASGSVTDSLGARDGVITGVVSTIAASASSAHAGTCSAASFDGGAIDVNGLPVSTASGDKTSVSFWMNWDGTNSVMPIGFNRHDLWFFGGSFGFNSGNGDIFGIASAGLANGWHHVVVEFTNNDASSNKIYIDGVSQALSQRRGRPSARNSVVNAHFRIGGWWRSSGYRFSGLLDEVKIYNGALSPSEVNADYTYTFTGTCPVAPPPPPAVLIASYDFNDTWSSSQALEDSTGSADGVIQGNVTRVISPALGLKPETCFAGIFSGGAIDINGLPVSTASGDQTSISFWMKWDGTNSIMPLGWRRHDLWFNGGSFGFNSSGGDIYGISSSGLSGSWHHVTVVFTNNNVTNNQIYIDGALQTLTLRRGSIRNSNAVVDPHLRLGGWWANNSYRFRGELDEVKVYSGILSSAEVNADYTNDYAGTCPVPPPPPPPILIASYNFNDNWSSGQAIEDSTGTANGVVSGNLSRISSPASGLKPDTCYSGSFNGGAIDINGLPVSTAAGDKTSISFWMRWNGTNSVMPLGWRRHDLWFNGGSFGFNSSGGDIYGISSSGLSGSWHHVTAIFTNNNESDNQLYIDGVLQTLTLRRGRIQDGNAVVNPHLRLGGWWASNGYRFRGELDEVRVYTGVLSQTDVESLRDETPSCTIIPVKPSPPIAEWRMDENTWDGSTNEVVDSAGTFDGTSFSSNTENSLVCRGGDFSASTSQDYLSLDNAALNGRTNFTLSVWGKTSNSGGQQTLFSAANSSQQNELIMFFNSATRFQPYIKGRTSPITVTNIADDAWHHFVMTRSGTNACFYIDSELQGCATLPAGALNVANGGLILSQEQDRVGGGFSASQDWDGLLDEALVFDTALSDAEILYIYNNQSAGLGWDGEVRNCISLLGKWSMDEWAWTGSVDQVIDSSGNAYHGTPANDAITDNIDPAIVSANGTCGYGYFDDAGGSSGDYIALPDFPNLTTSFTITAWIKTDNNTKRGQRIFADDENNNGGFAFSLGDGGTGRLRLYSRSIDQIILDGGSGVIQNDTWYFVAAVADITNSVRSIYVFDASGALIDFTTASFTGTWGSDSGISTIGGETNSGETANRFSGNIDEVQVYSGVMDQAAIAALVNETHACPLPKAEWRFDELSWRSDPNEVLDSVSTYHGVALGSDTVAGKLCNAADLSANSNTDYISLPNTALDGATDFTLSVWGQSSGSGQQTIFSAANSAQNNELIMFFTSATRFRPYLKGRNGSNITIPAINDGNWHHFVWTRSGANNCFYSDGVLRGCVNLTTNALDIDAGGLILGQEQDNVGGRFQASQDWEGLLDEPLIFETALGASDITTMYSNYQAGNSWDGSARVCNLAGLDHFEFINLPVSGSTCNVLNVQINACSDTASPCTAYNYSGDVEMTTSSSVGDWSLISGAGSINSATANDGAATYTFTSESTATLALEHTAASVITLQVEDSSGAYITTSGGISFSENAFDITEDPITVAGKDQQMTISMITRDSATGDCATATGYVGSKDLNWWLTPTADDPATGISPTIGGQSLTDSSASAITEAANFSLGVASVTLASSDVGKYAVNVRDASTSYSSENIDGLSDVLTVKPFGIAFDGITGGSGANPAGTATAGGDFISAGTPFTFELGAYLYQAADDANNDGVPDNSVDITDNGVTQAFAAPAVISVASHTPSTATPVGDFIPSSITSATFSGGKARITTAEYSEVGSVQLGASVSDYLSDTSADFVTQSQHIGRFYPDRIVINSSVNEAAACTDGFIYMGETSIDVNFLLEAQNARGVTTEHYDSAIAYNYLSDIGFFAENGDSGGVDLASRLSFTNNAVWDRGDMLLNLNGGAFNRGVSTDRIADLQLGLQVTNLGAANDSVNITNLDMNPVQTADCAAASNCNAKKLVGTFDMRYGRARIRNAFGPETQDLPLSIYTEYFDGSNFVPNTNDNCTPYDDDDLNAGSNSTETPDYISIDPAQSINAGKHDVSEPLTLISPGVVTTFNIWWIVDSWLKFNWNGAGNEDPTATAMFGQYRGHDRVIYWREVSN